MSDPRLKVSDDRVVTQTVNLTPEQQVAIGELGEGQPMTLEQTWHERGGTHLYVTRDDGRQWHVAAGNGNAVELNVHGAAR